ncbi:hypothetical protein M409DRAFT_67693 [Zasmidium cellare ATCC 36951]|uniref:T6SS Phospholipase effector Tle1-like catalytic domain-containing protein n=1 Tax=Zasmidium cellare ATCC 36951 TaxID=1080233 RepID=A0A6A6CBY2_ZASCE|nr:uncharacterized protein M409DRAFT_67693 [Zasmidium cellare ATCC 36951]KAF2164531.1 hypothetical protein M409DRAFT_67693 [Zasmidium cellare ATCC 36951]
MAGITPQAQQGLGPTPGRKSLILCFDGTGNKFQGNQSDSNIIKIFNLLDRQDSSQFHYYQPGIGTYVETSSLSRKSTYGRIKSWYTKAKDQAVGTSFGEHVMAGYKFLMRYYNDGDAIYFFGFSRGAYTARFLAQMLDYVGLLSAGNEEMLRFAWKTFSRWQMRTDETEEEKRKKLETFEFMKKFRETFSRPVCRIEFIGLFDCVNSVPQFESAWMTRSKFPYTAKTTARVIRHAVSIDERRAKFRQDLISERRHGVAGAERHHNFGELGDQIAEHMHLHSSEHVQEKEKPRPQSAKRPSMKKSHNSEALFRADRRRKHRALQQIPASSAASQISVNSANIVSQIEHDNNRNGVLDDDDRQDILEVWFAGQHGDIGGGWPLSKGEDRPLSDIALMWILREAQKAGMPLDPDKVKASNLFPDEPEPDVDVEAPLLQVEGQEVPESPKATFDGPAWTEEIHRIATTSKTHDSLRFGGGLGWSAVAAWKFMEWLPFRRMDLQDDGSWKAISWPLPRGETRDMNHDCKIHHSVIKRMEHDPSYRPGNLIVGGGGRGFIRAPKEYGLGAWEIILEPGDAIGEVKRKVQTESNGSANGAASNGKSK